MNNVYVPVKVWASKAFVDETMEKYAAFNPIVVAINDEKDVVRYAICIKSELTI